MQHKRFRQGERRPLFQPAERVGIDFTDMTKAKDGNSKILVMIDHAMKSVIVKATRDESAETEAKILFGELICKYGAPKELWSDRGKSFIGEVVKYFMDLF